MGNLGILSRRPSDIYSGYLLRVLYLAAIGFLVSRHWIFTAGVYLVGIGFLLGRLKRIKAASRHSP